MNKGVEGIKKRLKTIERRIKNLIDSSARDRKILETTDEEIKTLKEEKKDLEELIKPFLVEESL